MSTKIQVYFNFEGWRQAITDGTDPYGVSSTFDPITLERRFDRGIFGVAHQQLTENNVGILRLDDVVGDYMIENTEFRIVHSKLFKRVNDLKLVTPDGYEVKKADIPLWAWFIITDGKMRKLRTNHSNVGFDNYTFNEEPSFEIHVCDRKTRKENREKFQRIVSERILTSALLDTNDYSQYFTGYDGGRPQIVFLNDLKTLNFENAVDKYPVYFEVYFKLTDRIQVGKEDKHAISMCINRGAGSLYTFMNHMKKFEKDYVDQRNPITVTHLEVVNE